MNYMRRASFVFAFVLVALACVPGLSQTSEQQQPARTLYQRLGGYDAIVAVGDEFLLRLKQDKKLSRFFQGVSEDSQRHIRQLAVDQLCAATGGPCLYIGRSMKASHQGLGITKAQWDAAVKHLAGALDKFKVGEGKGRPACSAWAARGRHCRAPVKQLQNAMVRGSVIL